MKVRKSLLGTMISIAVGSTALNAQNYEVTADKNAYKESEVSAIANKRRAGAYIIQLKGKPAILRAEELGELIPSNQLAAVVGNSYNPGTAAMQAYTNRLKDIQKSIANEIGKIDVLQSYVHTFNGFSAHLTPQQAAALEAHADVQTVWVDEAFEPNTANTPAYLGLTGPGGQHSLEILGEDIIVGVLDTGIAPENASFADNETYSDPAALGWTGICDAGAEAEAGTFSCNNKLIGARYFDETFSSQFAIQYELGEFDSPRDADGHGSHTASTAAGNANVAAFLNGIPVGSISGVAPRARIAAYKVCWNSDYVNPDGDNERGCFYGDSMAAIDQAVADGVDVLNYSIGNGIDLDNPVYSASLAATAAGVFFAASAGNDGPDAGSTRNSAPWMTTVAASTYDGISAVNAIEITNREPVEKISILEGSITTPIITAGDKAGLLVIAEPLQGCFEGEGDDAVPTPLNNTEAIAGNIALIQRGSCTFAQKVERAQLSGATAVIIYSDDRPAIPLGGEGSFDIPGGMIGAEEGEALNTAITKGEAIRVKMSAGIFIDQVESGGIMADFSSRGENLSSADIIKPDITAPGVRILAAQTDTPMFGVQGTTQGYISGTSMSGPHIAGMAALLKGQFPQWSPAQIKSALMTTARQNIFKEVATETLADPFDFGSGHAVPAAAMNPGLTYNVNAGDYLGFMCGIDRENFVTSFSGLTCEQVLANGFTTEPSQLNYPSISIGELAATETISRTVTDVSGLGGNYVASIEAPAGINVILKTFDSEGVETDSNDLAVEENGTASYSLTFEKNDAVIFEQWTFGAITLTNEHGHIVRSPIAIKPAPDVEMIVPESLSFQLNRGRISFPVQMLYSGRTSLDYTGLVAPFGSNGAVLQDPDQTFAFNEAGMGTHFFEIPEGTKVARFSLRDSLIVGGGAEGVNLDLYVYRCDLWTCSQVGRSLNANSTEDVTLVNPEPRTDRGIGNVYLMWVHGRNLGGVESVNYTMPFWIADQAGDNTRIFGSSRALEGRFNYIRLIARELDPNFLYMGGITFYNAEGEAKGTTVLEVRP